MATMNHRIARAVSCTLAGLGLGVFSGPGAALPPGAQIDMKLLVIGMADNPATPGNEQNNLDMVTAILDRVGIPYQLVTYQAGDSWTSASLPELEDGVSHAYFQGVIFATSDPRMNAYTGWGGADATRLADFAFKYGIRVASPFAWTPDTGCLREPGPSEGINIGATPVNAFLTAAGKAAFPYLKAGTSSAFPLPLKNTYYYPGRALPATGSGTVGYQVLPAGTTVATWLNASSIPIASLCRFTSNPGDPASAKREVLAFTVAHAPYLMHSIALSYGIVDWVTKGIHLGEKRVWLDAEVDDIFLPDDEFPYVAGDGGYYRFEDEVRHALGLAGAPTPVTCTPTDAATGTPCEYRLVPSDFSNVKAWQDKARLNAWGTAKTINGKAVNTANTGGASYAEGLRLNMVYNGALADLQAAVQKARPCGSLCEPVWSNDTLTQSIYGNAQYFKWINHTWDHTNLNAMPYTAQGACPSNVLDTYTELCWNHEVQVALGFADYYKGALVTPEISGLFNRDALDAMGAFGVDVLVSDTSRPTPPPGTPGCPDSTVDASGNPVSWPLPAPNTGKYNCTALTTTATRPTPRYIYEVPRLPTALFYMVSTATEWANSYNFFYGKHGVLSAPPVYPYVDAAGNRRNLTYPQIIDVVSDTLLGYLLTYDNRPWMFHSANLRKYSGTRFLLGDLLEETLTKYNAYYQNQPVLSPNLKEIGDRMKQRMVYNAMQVQATLAPETGELSVSASGNPNDPAVLVRAEDAAQVVVPVTGIDVGTDKTAYGTGTAQKLISYVTLTPTGNNYSVRTSAASGVPW